MYCPVCNILLKPTTIGDQTLWGCSECYGVIINLAVLRTLLDRILVKEFWIRARNSSVQSMNLCPSCNRSFRVFEIQHDTRPVTLDLCKQCQLMWFDDKELETFPRKPGTDRLSPKAKQAIALAHVQNAHEQIERERNIRTILFIIDVISRFIL